MDVEARMVLPTGTPLLAAWQGSPNALIPCGKSNTVNECSSSRTRHVLHELSEEDLHNEEYWCTAKPSGTARFPFGPCAVGESLGKHTREMYSIPMSRKPWK